MKKNSAVLIIVDTERKSYKVDLLKLYADVRNIILSRQYNLPSYDSIMELSECKRINECFKIISLDRKIDTDVYLGFTLSTHENVVNLYYLSDYAPPVDLYDYVKIVDETELERLIKLTPIRTKVYGRYNNLVGIIVNSLYLKDIKINLSDRDGDTPKSHVCPTESHVCPCDINLHI